MKKLLSTIVVGIGFVACTYSPTEKTTTQKSHTMKNLISIVEIPTDDFSRAVAFYESILDVKIEEVDMDGTRMGVIPADDQTVNVVLVKGDDYKPTNDGVVIYLNPGNDLQPTLDKIEKSGGKIIVPKTEINAEMGFFALFIDTEGNKLGLHSSY